MIKDKRDPDPKRRYKMIYNAHNGRTWVFRTATSPDGTQWTSSPDFAVDRFIELSSFYKHNGLYVANGQSSESGQGGGSQGRQGYARISADFHQWLGEAAGAFALPEPAQAAERGKTKPYDQVHLGRIQGSISCRIFPGSTRAAPKRPAAWIVRCPGPRAVWQPCRAKPFGFASG